MSVEQKIKELLARVSASATDAETLSEEGAVPMGATSVAKDNSIKPAVSGDAKMPKQGSSEDASADERDENEPNQGAKAAMTVKPNTIQNVSAPGATPNFTTVGDMTSAVNQPNSKGNVPMSEESEEEEEEVAPMDVKAELSAIFGDDLSEEFAEKASAIFEAAVIARVNSEMETIVAQLEEQKAVELAEAKEELVEKIDSFLNYVVEQWMTENEIAIEKGLRTEIAEEFITGLKGLFKEHYIEVPEDKYDVMDELQSKADDLEAKLNDSISEQLELAKQLSDLKRAQVLESASKDLAATEAAKLKKLLEGVDFESEDLFSQKVTVIKENYFPKNAPSATPTQVQTLVEDASSAPATFEDNGIVSMYANALSRTVKKNK
jgi:hypothetical protein